MVTCSFRVTCPCEEFTPETLKNLAYTVLVPQRRIQSPKWDTICRFSRCCFLTPFLTCHPTFPLNPIQYESLKVLVTQSCPTLCDPMNCSSPGSSVHGNLQARILEWVAIPFSRGSSHPGTKPGSTALQTDSLPSEPPGNPSIKYITLLFLCFASFCFPWESFSSNFSNFLSQTLKFVLLEWKQLRLWIYF